MLALRLPSFNDRPSSRPRPSAAAVLVLPPWAAACKGRSEDAKLGFEGWGVEEEGAAGDYGRKEWAGWRGTGVLLPVPSRSLQEEPPRSQRQSYKERDFGRRAKPVEGDGRGPPRAWGLRDRALQYVLHADRTFSFGNGAKIGDGCKNFTVQYTRDNKGQLNEKFSVQKN